MIFDFRPVDKKSDICSNGVEQMKNCVDQFFQANKFQAVDHDPIKRIVNFSQSTNNCLNSFHWK